MKSGWRLYHRAHHLPRTTNRVTVWKLYCSLELFKEKPVEGHYHPLRKRVGLVLIMLMLGGLACNAPTGPSVITATPGALSFLTQTQIAQQITPAATETPDTGQPTATLQPGVTPSPTVCTYNMSFVKDLTIPDGTEVAAGSKFDKTWQVRNNGCLAWPTGTQLVYYFGDQMGGPASVALPATAIGDTVNVTVSLTAPTTTGEYTSYWQFSVPGAGGFGDQLFVDIKVVSAPTPTITVTPTTAATITATPTYAPFIGTWVAQAQDTTNITKLEIKVVEGVIIVHMWNKGVPSDVDRGDTTTPAADANDGVLYLSWTSSDLTETQQLSILLDGRLQVNGSVNYTDASRADINYTQYFVKK